MELKVLLVPYSASRTLQEKHFLDQKGKASRYKIFIFIGVKIFECTVLIKNERVKGTVDFKFAL